MQTTSLSPNLNRALIVVAAEIVSARLPCRQLSYKYGYKWTASSAKGIINRVRTNVVVSQWDEITN